MGNFLFFQSIGQSSHCRWRSFFQESKLIFFHLDCQVLHDLWKEYGGGSKAPQLTELSSLSNWNFIHLFGVVNKYPATVAPSRANNVNYSSRYTRFVIIGIELTCFACEIPKMPNPKQQTPKTLKSSRPRRPNVHMQYAHCTQLTSTSACSTCSSPTKWIIAK